ncbi:bile acid:sodium symporter family protein [candidate division KSB1 bacterium]|nr:bile acid:sodium symporter family protein [candidate division KSB1 bacterium]
MKSLLKYSGYLSLFLLILLFIFYFTGFPSLTRIMLVFTLFTLALYFMGHPVFKNFAFTAWVFVFVAASLFYPSSFGTWFGFDLKFLIVPLIQIIMFGMGTTLSLQDFTRVLVMPIPVLIGFVLQFTIMPLIGFTLATLFNYEPEVAAGIILVGSCPGGVASNLMTYLAGGDVALSVTMTSCSTLLSPVMTPFWMKTLAGRLVPINFIEMMVSIIDMIIVPIIAGIIANKILYGKHWLLKKSGFLIILVIAGFLSVFVLFVSPLPAFIAPLKNGLIIGFFLLALVALIKWIMDFVVRWSGNWMDKTLPLISMLGICFIIGIITARSSEKLLNVGFLLLVTVILHNSAGYLLGYWISRACRMDKRKSITVAIEVGLQNGGMASGLAMGVLKSVNAAIAPAIFGPWMNISGSVLANWFRRKLLKES